jgi:hypothetical protein
MTAMVLTPAEIGEPKREWQGLDAMDGGQRRTETWTSSRMERVSRVEPAAVRHAGGERSAQHRFPRGAAGIDKGSAAASLVPFTAPVIKTFRPTPGERNHSTKATCKPHRRMAATPYPAYARVHRGNLPRRLPDGALYAYPAYAHSASGNCFSINTLNGSGS